ncbi:MAG: PIG-L family deacetylase [Hahellaceae bacterium]|nr:PIG-L family deacetylase [Hahellaceae bacterium]
MKSESELIPYQCSPLPEGPWLVFVPHADDESFGMGGTLLLARQQGIDITLVFMTDGALGAKDPVDGLVSTRRKEAEAVTKKLNAKAVFLQEPDRGLHLKDELICKICDMVSNFAPLAVFFPSPLELHPDHRATALLVWEALRRLDAFKGAIFAYDISVQSPINMLIDTSSVIECKHGLMATYTSQISENNYIGIIESLDQARTYTLSENVKAAEGFLRFASATEPLQSYMTSIFQSYLGDMPCQPENNNDAGHPNEQTAIADQLNEEIQELRRAIEEILNSTSWRVTRPLRYIKQKLTGHAPK